MDLISGLLEAARARRGRVVLPEGEDPRIVAAARRLKDEGLAEPVLLGAAEAVRASAVQAGVSLEGISVLDSRSDASLERYGAACASRRETLTPAMARRLVAKPLYF